MRTRCTNAPRCTRPTSPATWSRCISPSSAASSQARRTQADAIAALDDHGDLYQARVASAAGSTLIEPHIFARVASVLAEAPAWHRVSRLAVIGHLVADLGLTDLVTGVVQALDPYMDELVAPGTALVCAGPVRGVLAARTVRRPHR